MTPSSPSDGTTPTGGTCRSTAASGAAGTSATRPDGASRDAAPVEREVGDYTGLYGEDLTKAVARDVAVARFEAGVELEEERRARVGDEKHPINVEKIKQGLGCLPICEVRIDFPPLVQTYLIEHWTPAHERVFKIYDRYGYFVREHTQVFKDERHSRIAVDPYLLDRYEDREDIARHIIERLKYEWNANWPHHA